MRTKKQIQAQRRNEMLRSIAGMISNLERFRNRYCKDPFLKGSITASVTHLECLYNSLKKLPENRILIMRRIGSEDATWHDLFKAD